MGRLITLYCPGCQGIERRDQDESGDSPDVCPSCGAPRELLDSPPPARRPLWPTWISVTATVVTGLATVSCGVIKLMMFSNQLSGGGFYPPLWLSGELLGLIASFSLAILIAVWVIPLVFRKQEDRE